MKVEKTARPDRMVGDVVDSLSRRISGFKRAGEKNSNNKYFQFWQQDNHPIELYGYETLKQKLNYHHKNAVRSGNVYETWHYKYSSSSTL